MSGYNGWTNWETWECMNVIDSTAEMSNAASRCIDSDSLQELVSCEIQYSGTFGNIDTLEEFHAINFNEIFDSLNIPF